MGMCEDGNCPECQASRRAEEKSFSEFHDELRKLRHRGFVRVGEDRRKPRVTEIEGSGQKLTGKKARKIVKKIARKWTKKQRIAAEAGAA